MEYLFKTRIFTVGRDPHPLQGSSNSLFAAHLYLFSRRSLHAISYPARYSNKYIKEKKKKFHLETRL